ncbi:hypothetical protein [Paeniglutamicibacter terrestris]|uniref:Uncharacterized protein n=1 Tax=Paeniglutamicibacter terrestris TaxID=2723403 RepID=A0ABX1G7M8_9MICC|nr:hypothetical protein [Paeniglutamicibacter terrestris]NKG22244.1 hypothetical protein [Paeniglutamicibacter terrestris]
MTTPMAISLDDKVDWFVLANEALDVVIESQHLFSADDLRGKVPAPAHPNWWGALFNAASAQGRIVKAGPMLSRSKSRRGGLIWQWKQVIEHEDRTP